MIVLTLNSGSSSLKFGLYRATPSAVKTLMVGMTEGGTMRAEDDCGTALPGTPLAAEGLPASVGAISRLIRDGNLPAPAAVGHRIVHGGVHLHEHCLIDDGVLRELEGASALSPLHAPAALLGIHAAIEAFPDTPQVACFDTAFHSSLPDVARTLPLASKLRNEGIRRYGFHGLSCESILHQLGKEPPARVIIAHLGNGASVTAVLDGRSVDTSMGLTPSGGVMMGTRSGDLDPGVLIYLLREKGFDPSALEDLIDHDSGLLGVSGLSSDLRRLHAAPGNPDAKLAIAMFCMSVAKQIAAMIAVLDGADLIVFTGGIGEHDAAVRSAICARLRWIGVVVDDSRNRGGEECIGADTSRCEVRVLPSQEDDQIARHVSFIASP